MESKKERIAALQRLIQKYQDSYYGGEAEQEGVSFNQYALYRLSR